MRPWFARHPNLVVVALVICWLIASHDFLENIEQRRWVRLALQILSALVIGEWIRKWWVRTGDGPEGGVE